MQYFWQGNDGASKLIDQFRGTTSRDGGHFRLSLKTKLSLNDDDDAPHDTNTLNEKRFLNDTFERLERERESSTRKK